MLGLLGLHLLTILTLHSVPDCHNSFKIKALANFWKMNLLLIPIGQK